MPYQRAPPAQHHFGRADQQCQHHIEIAMRDPSQHGHIAPTPGIMHHRLPPSGLPVAYPGRPLHHVAAGDVVVHRNVRPIGHIEIAVAFREEGIERDARIRRDDAQPGPIEVRHIRLGDGAPAVADLLRLDARGFHRIRVIRGIGGGHLIEIEDRGQLVSRLLGNRAGVELGDPRDLLQLDAARFDRIAGNDRAAGRQEGQRAVHQQHRQDKRDGIRLPPLAVGDEQQHDFEHQYVPGVFGRNKHDNRGNRKRDQCAVARACRALPVALRRMLRGHMQLVPRAEPPDEGEGEHWRFGQRYRREQHQRAAQEEQQHRRPHACTRTCRRRYRHRRNRMRGVLGSLHPVFGMGEIARAETLWQ